MFKHVPFSSASAHQPHTDIPPRRPLVLDRRGFLLGGIAAFGTLTLSACTSDGTSLTGVFAASPQPDEKLVNFYWALKDAAEAASGKKAAGLNATAKVYEDQAALLAKEISRQCGRDDEGKAPEKCTATTAPSARPSAANDSNTAPNDEELRMNALTLITAPASSDKEDALQSNRTVAGIATGIYAALAVASNSAALEEAQRIDEKAVADGFGGAQGEALKALADAIDMTYGAIYVSGLALAADGGNNRETLRAVADRLRDFRESALAVLEAATADQPIPQASYQPPGGAPKDSASALETQLKCTQPITKQLRFLVTQTNRSESREFAARWCGLIARLEAALERAQGNNPLDHATRGA